MNLGWKLASAIHGRAPEGLLDTYQAERHPVGAKVLDWSRAQVAIMRPGPSSRALNAIVGDLMTTIDGATYFAGRVWGVSLHYDLGGAHPLVGSSVPNFAFEDGSTVGDLMHSGQGVLLDFEQSTSLEAVAARYGERLRYISRRANEQFGLSAVLIRPDGVVAWACGTHPDGGELAGTQLQAAASHWLMKEIL